MKHLKKILVALVLVAMVASSVIVVALAEDYTGTVSDANALYEKYEDAEASSKLSLEDAKAAALADLYAYISTSPIDPSSEGYGELIANYNAAVTKVAYCYWGNCSFVATTADEKADIMTSIYLAYAASPLYGCAEYEVPLAYKCANSEHTEPTAVYFDSTESFYKGIPADAVCPDGCSAPDLVGMDMLKYTEIKKDVEKLNADVTGLVVDKLFQKVADAESQANYFDLLASREALASFLSTYSELAILLPESSLYTGSFAVVEAKLSALNANGTFEEIKTGLADIYNYLLKEPVSPASENYASFIENYNALCDKLMLAFKAKVDAAESVEQKVVIFNEMHIFLAGVEDDPATEDVDETVAPQFISERVVNTYNTMRTEIIGEYEEMVEGIAGAVAFDKEIPEITYVLFDVNSPAPGDTANKPKSFRERLDTALKQVPPIKETPTLNAVRAQFNSNLYGYLTKDFANRIDPTSEGYAEAIADYNYIAGWLIKLYVDTVENAPTLADKYTKLMTFREYLVERPFSSDAIKAYNDARAEVLATYKSFYNGLSVDGLLPSYKSHTFPVSNVKAETLNSLLSDITDAENAYTAAAIEDKPAALEAWKSAATAMYSFISGVSVNPNDGFVASVSLNYTNAVMNLYNAIIEEVNATEDPALKAAALAEVKEFLAEYPLSANLLYAYNMKVSEVYAGDGAKIESESLSSVYFTAVDAVNKIMNAPDSLEGEALDDFLADAKLLQECYEQIIAENKPLDSVYSEFISAYETAAETVATVILKDTNNAINSGDTELTVEAVTKYALYLGEVNYKSAIEQFNTTVTGTIDNIGGKIVYLEKTEFVEPEDSQVAYLVSKFETMMGEVDLYNAAQSYEDKLAAFKVLYTSVSTLTLTIDFIDSAYGPLMEAYTAASEDFADRMIATLSGHTDARAEYDALMAVGEFINEFNYSTEISAAYNAKLAELKDKNLGAVSELIGAGIKTVVYASPENTLSDFSGFGTLVSGTDVDAAELASYFGKLSGTAEGAKPIDVFADGVDELVKAYNEAFKLYYENANAEYLAVKNDAELDAAETAEALTGLLETMNADLGKLTVSSDIAELFKTVRDAVSYNHKTEIKATFLKYKMLVAEIHAYIEACPVDRTALSADELAAYKRTLTKLEGAEYAEAEAYIFDFDNATGGIPTITKNQAYKKVEKYIEKYGLDSSFSDKALVDAMLSDMFTEFLAEFGESINGLSPTERENELKTLAHFLGFKKYPASLVALFNAAYPDVTVNVTAPDAVSNEGSLAELGEYIMAFDTVTGAKAMREQLDVIVAYLNENPVSSTSEYDNIMHDVERMETDMDIAISEAKELSQKEAAFTDYSLGYQFNYTMEDGKPYTTYLSNNTNQEATISVKSEDGNKYTELDYRIGGGSPYFNVTKFNGETPFVLEFDLMFPNVEERLDTFYINSTEWGLKDTGARVTSRLFSVTSENGKAAIKYIFGDYSNARDDKGFPNYQEGVDEAIEFESGQWMHIAIVIDPIKFETELVVDYTSLGRKPLIVAASSGGADDTCKFTELRFQATAGTIYCYDNLKIYTGNSYRDPNRFADKTESELFNFYVDYAADSANLTVNRISAYYSAAGLVGSATSEEHKNIFAKISVDDILDSAQAHYRDELGKIIEPLKTGSITTSNYLEKEGIITSARTYIKTNQTYMDQSSDWFKEMNDILLAAEDEIEWVQNLMEYTKVLPLFQRAPTLTALKKHFAVADKYYKLCNLDDPAILAAANADEVVKAVIEELKENYDVALVLEDDIGAYHNVYMPERIRIQTYTENARKLVECVNAIELLVPDKTGLTTEQYHALILEKAQANVDYVNEYMIAMRPVVVSGEYDEGYENIEETLVIYNLLDQMFYEIVQEAHYEHLEEQIARYKATNSYIERAGICTYIENYITDNSVDVLSQRGSLINYTVTAYKAELVTYKGEYEAILAANTNSFIAIVERMQAYTEYKDLKPLYQDAIDNYYYNMNVDSEDAQNAIAVFSVYDAMIQDWELNSKLFIDASENLNLRKPAQIYRALVNCSKYVDGANADVEGVAAALKLYNEKLAEYNEMISVTNGEISAAIDVVCSVRTNVIASTVLAIIKNIFTK